MDTLTYANKTLPHRLCNSMTETEMQLTRVGLDDMRIGQTYMFRNRVNCAKHIGTIIFLKVGEFHTYHTTITHGVNIMAQYGEPHTRHMNLTDDIYIVVRLSNGTDISMEYPGITQFNSNWFVFLSHTHEHMQSWARRAISERLGEEHEKLPLSTPSATAVAPPTSAIRRIFRPFEPQLTEHILSYLKPDDILPPLSEQSKQRTPSSKQSKQRKPASKRSSRRKRKYRRPT